MYQSRFHSQTSPARSACPHRPSPLGEREPTGSSSHVCPQNTASVSSIAVEVGGADHGYTRCSSPPAAAKFHSASVESRPPSHAQKANASNQFTQLMGSSSCSPGASVQLSPPHLSAAGRPPASTSRP